MFIDQIEDTEMYPGIKNYFSNRLKFKIAPEFIQDEGYINNLEDLNITQVYKINSTADEKLMFNMRTVTENDSRKLMIESRVHSKQIPEITGLDQWLEESHTVLHDFFFKMTQNISNLFD